MPWCIEVIDVNRWGLRNRLPQCFEYLTRYGTHAREVLPQLREIRQSFGKPNGKSAMIDQGIRAIEDSTTTPTLIGLDEFIKIHHPIR